MTRRTIFHTGNSAAARLSGPPGDDMRSVNNRVVGAVRSWSMFLGCDRGPLPDTIAAADLRTAEHDSGTGPDVSNLYRTGRGLSALLVLPPTAASSRTGRHRDTAGLRCRRRGVGAPPQWLLGSSAYRRRHGRRARSSARSAARSARCDRAGEHSVLGTEKSAQIVDALSFAALKGTETVSPSWSTCQPRRGQAGDLTERGVVGMGGDS